MVDSDDGSCGILDLSKKCLKKIPKTEDAQQYKVLLLDDNELQKIDNIDCYLKIEKLSLCKNQLLRMYGVCRLHCLKELNLSYNGILSIEGLKDLLHLTHLNLEGNNIKTIEHLNTNTKLEYLNLSENSIGSISDISFLKCLKELLLNGNRISHLRQCDKYLPQSIETLTLAKNNLTDLNELCTLVNLCKLNNMSIAENPCVQMTGNSVVGFDYRPFVLNWCMGVKAIDGFVVTAIESLKAEWLYSQGRGRQFRIGEHNALARYLSSVCPLSGEALENENERKLRLILSKAQQHQRQLQEQISHSENNPASANNSPSSARRKGTRIQSPRVTRLAGRQNSPDAMSSSYHGHTSTNLMNSSVTETANNSFDLTKSLIDNITSDSSIMTQSLDPTVLGNNAVNTVLMSASMHESMIIPNQQSPQILMGGPLIAASRMVPVPESLMSPDCGPATIIQQRMSGSINHHQIHHQIPKAIKTKDNARAASSPHPSKHASSPRPNRRSVVTATTNERSSPQMSPRKVMMNISNNQKMHQIQNRIKSSPVPISPPEASSVISSDDEDSERINIEKLKSIRNKAAQHQGKSKENKEMPLFQQSPPTTTIEHKATENSAILIQKMWRGYITRKKKQDIADILQKKRTQEYIVKLTQDMEMTKAALENERKIQQLQMQAINALWKKVSTMQPTSDGGKIEENSSVHVVQDLTKTCSMLMNQVQQLQISMRDIINCVTIFAPAMAKNEASTASNGQTKDSSETQTDIIAVHTPQIENPPPFPFTSKLTRPSTLPISSSSDTSPRITSQEGKPIIEIQLDEEEEEEQEEKNDADDENDDEVKEEDEKESEKIDEKVEVNCN